jgi:hypothetical protein
MGKAQGTRPRGHRIDVWVKETELAEIDSRAQLVRLSRSQYLRNLGLGYLPKSQFDQEAILALIRLHADQGRLGGLLKLWLVDRKGYAEVRDVRSLLHQIEALQREITKLVIRAKNY